MSRRAPAEAIPDAPQVWCMDLRARGERSRRVVRVYPCGDPTWTNADGSKPGPPRWAWLVNDDAGSCTLDHSTRDYATPEEALASAQRKVLFNEPGFVIVRMAQAVER